MTGPAAATRFITLNEVAPETADWTLNLNGLDFEQSYGTDGDAEGRDRGGLGLRQHDRRHPPDAHPPGDPPGHRPHTVRRRRLPGRRGPRRLRRYPGGIDPTPFATGPMEPPDPTERGFKDTTKANPGYFTTIRAKFDLPDGVTAPQTYVYHCHIVEHEDNDMMLPFIVTP